MNKTAIKNFAIWARVQLIEAAKQRAYEYEITEKGENKPGLDMIGGRLLSADEKKQRQQLISQINAKGYTQVMEEAAYTWFNRFIALRYMEVNGFLPSKVRVFTDENGVFKPEILKEAMTVEIEGLDRAVVLDLLDKQNNEQLYKYLLITQCNALNQGLPYMFEKISNWTELLFPANLLRPDSVLGQMVTEIPEEDWQDAVQIIGWMYQYYNSELKDDTFALLKKNVKITKERIPAATQLFTPDWIVRYMVENSLGRLWYAGHPSFDKSEWKYYLDEAQQEPEVGQQLQKIRADYATINPEDIKVIDPCMGSGHILVYAFDVLLQIYTSCGWSERDAAKSIVENNLYGLDIDDRAGQLAYFAVMMKARKYSRRILNGETKPNVLAIQDSGFITDDFIDYVAQKDQHMKADLSLLRSSLKDAKEYGSIINMPKLNFAALYERMDIISREYAEDIFQLAFQTITAEQLLPLVKQAEIMAQKYDVVVTNPPYMGGSGMSSKLTEFVKKNYPDSKSDLFAVFIERCGAMLNKRGYQAMITQHAWMFLSSYEKLRTKLLACDTINMAHLGARAFEEIGGEVVQTTSFVLRNIHTKNYKGTYCRLIDPTTQSGKEEMFLSGENRYQAAQSNFSKIPGAPIAYWVSNKIIEAFQKTAIADYGFPKQGFATGDNNRFLRLWYEVNVKRVNFACKTLEESNTAKFRWYPCNKGGEYRKWYGNNNFVANWENNGHEMRDFSGSVIRNPQFYFQPGITWSSLASGGLSMRYSPSGFLFESKGSVCFLKDHKNLNYLLALTNSKIVDEMLSILSPTLDYHEGPMSKVPVIVEERKRTVVDDLTADNISLVRSDWDSFETSWDFKKHPLV